MSQPETQSSEPLISPQPPEAPVRRPMFRTHWLPGVLLLALLVRAVIAPALNHKDGWNAPPEVFVGGAILAIGVLILAYGPALLAYRIAGRSSKAGNIALVIMIGLMFSADLAAMAWRRARVAQRSQVDASVRELDAALQETRRRAQERVQAGEYPTTTEDSAAMVAAMRAAAAKASGPRAVIMNANADALERINAASKPYEKAIKSFAESGGLDVRSIAAREDIAKRLAAIEELARTNKEFTQKLRENIDVYAKTLGDGGLSREQQS